MVDWLDPDKLSEQLRAKVVRLAEERVFITDFNGTSQVQDLSAPPNCGGLGRVRHFKRDAYCGDWTPNPLPIDPAAAALGLDPGAELIAQVFQLGACNLRCWYCFVPYSLLTVNPKHGKWLSADDLIDLYLAEHVRAAMIDLTGGHPDLAPEWVVWMMKALRRRGLEGKVFLWSDDNLTTDYFWTALSESDRALIATFAGYGRVACFKGFDERSFSFNTRAAPDRFTRQFDLMDRMIRTGIDHYAYVTLTTPTTEDLDGAMKRFVDRLQTIHPLLPLRTVPLRVHPFEVVKRRLSATDWRITAFGYQHAALQAWLGELESRFTPSQRNEQINRVALAR